MYSRSQPQQQGELAYELNVSPRNSIDSTETIQKESNSPSSEPLPPSSEQPAPTPSIRLLFSFLSRRHVPLLLLPAILSSLIAGGIAPFMTFVVGQAFNSFAEFPLSNPTQADKDALLRGVGLAAVELVGLAVGSMALGSITSALWIWVGEINVAAVRRHVYARVAKKEIVWFDLNLGSGDASGDVVGAGGLMAKFSKETDDVRHGSSLALGTIIQNLTTCLACLVLAFSRSYQLTLVILSAVPLLTLVQGFSQALAGPLLEAERHSTAVAATRVERAVASIATVKAFNAQEYELSRAQEVFKTLRTQARKLNTVWAISSGSAQFVMMAMFVQGFWFGAKLVREGKVEPGHVMAVFWACLIATSNLQMCIPQLIVLARGKESMSALVALAESTVSPPAPNSPSDLPPSPTTSMRPVSLSHPRALRKITPQKCTGELALYNVSFAYPARPAARVLSNVSLFLPAGETTYIVGGSGSGKSTIASLLVGMYTLTGHSGIGMIAIDEQDITFLAPEFLSAHIMCLSQSSSAQLVLAGRTMAENILAALPAAEQARMGQEDCARAVRAAAQAALLHEWIGGLERGYDTPLAGVGSETNSNADGSATSTSEGVGLSGGQRQRLALARAFIRNPTVLILDEATSALDPPARLLVAAALRRRRRNRTTVVITHDLSQIEMEDFVYVMRGGRVAEGGYRGDLECIKSNIESEHTDGVEGDIGEFARMSAAQQLTGGALPVKDVPAPLPVPVLVEEDPQDENKEVETQETPNAPTQLRPLTFGNWMFEVVADLTGVASGNPGRVTPSAWGTTPRSRGTIRQSVLPSATVQRTQTVSSTAAMAGHKHKRRPSSIQIVIPPTPARPLSRRYSMPFTPTSAATTIVGTAPWKKDGYGYEEEEEDAGDSDVEEFDREKYAMENSAATARAGRGGRERREWVRFESIAEDGRKPKTRKERKAAKAAKKAAAAAASSQQVEQADANADDYAPPAFWALVRAVYPTIPHKPFLLLGVIACVASGTMTPVFSFLLSRLLFEVSTGAQDASLINRFGALVLGIAALDGLLLGVKYFVMETAGMLWTTRLRALALDRVLKQDKKWFDRGSHAPARLVQAIVKDGDDARNLIAVVLGQFVVVAAMLGVGLVWAMVRGWQLTLAGFAIAPVFAIVMAVQTRLVAKCEVRNKRAREEVARGYYETIINVRGIRCMAFDPIFTAQFDAATSRALQTGVRGALVEGCTYGVASALIYLAEALLFYVGALLIAQGTYSYLQMVEVLNLVVFSVTIGAQLMAFTERIAKAVQATGDFHRLMSLDTTTDEAKGSFKPSMDGDIHFENVDFAYPAAPNVKVLKNVSLDIAAGECVAIVGASGSGKSTLAALLQRLYEPARGTISVGGTPLEAIDVTHLRTHVSVVSQTPNLFDASIADNIRYGDAAARWVDAQDVRRAAKRANVHDFIMGLPQGYDTPVGENAAMISGGQAQRLQIARALARPADILVLDECTSALDAENQATVLETIAGLTREGARPTTVMVTHKVQIMQMCDRIVVLQDGETVESGTYEALMARKGVFATLASGGEWVGE